MENPFVPDHTYVPWYYDRYLILSCSDSFRCWELPRWKGGGILTQEQARVSTPAARPSLHRLDGTDGSLKRYMMKSLLPGHPQQLKGPWERIDPVDSSFLGTRKGHSTSRSCCKYTYASYGIHGSLIAVLCCAVVVSHSILPAIQWY